VVVTEPVISQFAHAKASVRVTLEDPDGGQPIVKDVETGDFETTERGVAIGPLFVPWHRVIRYHWEIRQEFSTTVGDAPSRSQIRVLVDDGSASGETIVVPADRFEGGPWAIAMLVDRHLEPEQGVLVVDKVFVPWGRVLEYERMPLGVAAPSRPDLAVREADAEP
jgi:hypothetical protein